MSTIETPAVMAIRRFNRFHTQFSGALGGDLHGQGVTLTEARVLYELARRDAVQASGLARDLGLDPAYLSRILKRFSAAGWVARERALLDGRAFRLALTPAGRAAFAPLEAASNAQAGAILSRLTAVEQADLVAALATAQTLLGGPDERVPPTIRPHAPGDIGWVVAAHGRLYADEHGFDASFEALVAEICARFLREFRPEHERCLIAELDGRAVGSAFVVRASDEVAKLRLVLVERRARGFGLGKALVAQAIAFARTAGYARMTLWTNDILHAARAIYVAAGFRLVSEEPHRSFGRDLVGQYWELDLRAPEPLDAP